MITEEINKKCLIWVSVQVFSLYTYTNTPNWQLTWPISSLFVFNGAMCNFVGRCLHFLCLHVFYVYTSRVVDTILPPKLLELTKECCTLKLSIILFLPPLQLLCFFFYTIAAIISLFFTAIPSSCGSLSTAVIWKTSLANIAMFAFTLHNLYHVSPRRLLLLQTVDANPMVLSFGLCMF